MAIILRYVDKQGSVVEHFLEIVHVVDTTSHNLKASIDAVFAKHCLSISKLHGQGYAGASNMRGEFNGLKSPILKENPSAHYIHCFAHQLQLALVGLSKYHPQVDFLFTSVNKIATTVGASARRRDILREAQATKILEAIDCGERETGRGLNQEMAPKRLCDTHWSSHYNALVNLTVLWSSVKEAFESITSAKWGEKKGDALALTRDLGSFEFAFSVHLVRNVLGITNELSIALQRKDQDILNAVNQVAVAKERLQETRDIGWDSFLEEVSSFATEHDIDIPNIDDIFLLNRRQRRNAQDFKNFHHYWYDLFNAIIDIQLQELNNRFNEVNTELLLCVACLDPRNSFAAFDKNKLLLFAKLYSQEFLPSELLFLSNQLENFIRDLHRDDEFSQLKGLGDLAKKMVETRKHMIFPLVYKFVKLVLILPVATASVERVFSAMNVMKSELRNRMGDEWLNDSLVTYIKSKTFDLIDKDVIF